MRLLMLFIFFPSAVLLLLLLLLRCYLDAVTGTVNYVNRMVWCTYQCNKKGADNDFVWKCLQIGFHCLIFVVCYSTAQTTTSVQCTNQPTRVWLKPYSSGSRIVNDCCTNWELLFQALHCYYSKRPLWLLTTDLHCNCSPFDCN